MHIVYQSAVCAGYQHPVDDVVTDLMACLEDSALPLMQFTEAFAVVQVRNQHCNACLTMLHYRGSLCQPLCAM